MGQDVNDQVHAPNPQTGSRAHALLSVLLVDDDPDILLALTEILPALGHNVAGQATCSREALSILTSGVRPDIAIVDIRLAGGDNGLDLARGMLAEYGLRSIIVSGSLLSDDDQDCWFAGTGALAFIAKPFRKSNINSALFLAAEALRCPTPPPSITT